MEFPELGKNCANSVCKQLDFLPMKCDACALIFCKDHIQYSGHNCTESYRKDKKVPVCPLCNKPIPLKPGEVADDRVGAHIDSDCQSDPARERRKVYTNRCSKKGCKVKEMVSVKCDRCHQNYCLKHRHETDHECTPVSTKSIAASAAISRSKQQQQRSSQPAPPRRAPQQSLLNSIGASLAQERNTRSSERTVPVGNFQSGMTEDEALQRALQLSEAEQPGQAQRPMTQQEKDDLALAQAIAASEQQGNTNRSSQSNQRTGQSSCTIN